MSKKTLTKNHLVMADTNVMVEMRFHPATFATLLAKLDREGKTLCISREVFDELVAPKNVDGVTIPQLRSLLDSLIKAGYRSLPVIDCSLLFWFELWGMADNRLPLHDSIDIVELHRELSGTVSQVWKDALKDSAANVKRAKKAAYDLDRSATRRVQESCDRMGIKLSETIVPRALRTAVNAWTRNSPGFSMVFGGYRPKRFWRRAVRRLEKMPAAQFYLSMIYFTAHSSVFPYLNHPSVKMFRPESLDNGNKDRRQEHNSYFDAKISAAGVHSSTFLTLDEPLIEKIHHLSKKGSPVPPAMHFEDYMGLPRGHFKALQAARQGTAARSTPPVPAT